MDEQTPNFRARLRRVLLVSLALAPFLLSLVGTSHVPRGRKISGTKELPPLAFRQYSVNLHEVVSTARLTAPFAFWNRSRETLEITKLEPSCGCLAPRLLGNRKEYEPGGQGLFEVQVETARETPGPHTYSIRVHYRVNDELFEETVMFRCDIPERSVAVNPPELYFYQLAEKPLASEFLVEDHRGRHLTVLEAVTTSPHLSLTVGPREQTGEETSVTPVQVNVSAQVPPGTHTSFITVRTDDTDFPIIRVPVFLQGKPQGMRLTSGVREPGEIVKPAAAREDAPREDELP